MSGRPDPAPHEEFARQDTAERSIRVIRERYVESDGSVRYRTSVALFVRTMRGWARDRAVGIKRGELQTVIDGLTRAKNATPALVPITHDQQQLPLDKEGA